MAKHSSSDRSSSMAPRTRPPISASPCDGEPARSGRRSDRHGQDEVATGDGRAAQCGRGAGCDGRHQRRSVGACTAWRRQRQDRRASQGHRRRLGPTAYPVEFLSLGTEGVGVPVRATITSFGPILLSKVLGLNQTQESTLGLIFHWADQKGLPLLDVKDLRSVITYLTSDEGKPELKALGAVSPPPAGVIL